MKKIVAIKFFIFCFSLVFTLASYGQENKNKIDSLTILQQKQEGVAKANTLRLLGVEHYYNSYYTYSLESALEALDIFEYNNKDSAVVLCNLLLGGIYERSGDFVRAEKHNLKALDGAKRLNYTKLESSAFLNLALIAGLQKDYNKSYKYNYKALILAKNIDDKFGIIRIYSNLSAIYSKQGMYKKSVMVIDSGLVILKNISKTDKKKYASISREISLKLNLSNSYLSLKEVVKAEDVLSEIYLLKKSMTLRHKEEYYRLLMDINRMNKNYKNALKYSELQKEFIDSLNIQEHAQKFIEINIENEVKYKEQENQLLLREKEVAELKIIEQESKVNMLLLILLFSLTIIAVVSYYYITIRSKNRQLVQTNLEMLSRQKNNLSVLKLEKKKGNSSKSEISEEQRLQIVDKLNIAFQNEIYKDDSLTVTSLAKKLDTNRNYLTIVIKELNPSGFLDFVNEFRIKNSWKMLSDPNFFHLTIEHISQEVGFKSQPTFNKAFKKFTGVTPSFYLSEIKKKEFK